MKPNFRNYFYYSKTQRNGIVILACIILLAFFLPNLLPYYFKPTTTDFSQFEAEIAEFEAQFAEEETLDQPVSKNRELLKQEFQLFTFNPNTVSKDSLILMGLPPSTVSTFIKYRNAGAQFNTKEDLKKIYGLKEADYNRLAPYTTFSKSIPKNVKKSKPKVKAKPTLKILTPFPFNPNEADEATLLKLGLSKKVVQTLLNFRAKGGKFWKKQDFNKIYGVTATDYKILAPFIDIPKPLLAKNTNIPKDIPKNFEAPVAIKIDVNKATVEDWEKLKGIGNLTAKRLVNFRDKLGGFTTIEQIKSTYNVPDSLIDNLSAQLILSPILDANKIRINRIAVEELKLHPYIKTKQAYLIINFRTNHGDFTKMEDFKKVKALSFDFIKQIEPYISFE